ncbi:hypothetical protein KSP39_PZI019147 [Platanthera zijinensis]|uniref:Co-chaperone protein p23 n=1 Tax=Platanthera zijinensis TaxID=2320716 RepID=A0AAP0B1Z7_9ASPA
MRSMRGSALTLGGNISQMWRMFCCGSGMLFQRLVLILDGSRLLDDVYLLCILFSINRMFVRAEQVESISGVSVSPMAPRVSHLLFADDNFIFCGASRERLSRHPEVKWAQRFDKVYLTILLADAKNVQISLEPDGIFTFSGTTGSDNNLYDTSKLNTGDRSIFCVIEKAEKGWWKKLLRGDGKLPHYVKVDWDKWVDEDEDDGWLFDSTTIFDTT